MRAEVYDQVFDGMATTFIPGHWYIDSFEEGRGANRLALNFSSLEKLESWHRQIEYGIIDARERIARQEKIDNENRIREGSQRQDDNGNNDNG